ncbi:lipid II:glycine glycyltransferase FemX [Rubrobacter aplysinae]|uniref:lipid II:glycine glycyltransferase FemX n=1 Tax=Rubrobacter aplysinae TaxID=909625 RepID=UPI00064B85B6|nr:peptidoglycan bridge formation glycyltransferase FemA/FemB family protein [Rubrobacter aplysinae]
MAHETSGTSPETTPGRATGAYGLREVTGADQQEWDAWLAASPGGGHALQSHQWGKFKKEQGWQPLRLLLEKDGEVAGAGQFLLRSTFPIPGKVMYASKGPWLPWDDTEAVEAFFEEATRIARREGAHTLKIEPEVYDEREDVKKMLGGIGFEKARYDLNFDATILMDLDQPEDELMANMSGKTTRYNVRLAGRKGVEVREPEDFDWAFEKFYEWLGDMAEQKEGYDLKRPPEYYHRMMSLLNEVDQGHFFFAFHEGQPLSVVYVFVFGNKMWYMQGASDRENRKLKPTYVLQWEVMRWAKSQGITYYDMVGIPKKENRDESDPYYGVYKFKLGFGGEVVDFIGCMDLPVRPRLAAMWYRLEPLYYRAYLKLKKSIFY